MKKQHKLLIFISSTIIFLLASGPVLSKQNTDFEIKIENSKKANVSQVRLVKTTEGYMVTGKIYNKVKNRSTPIPGHVDISVVDTNGKTVNTAPVPIYRMSRKSQFAKFKRVLKVSPAVGSSIRVAHHNAPLGINAADLKHK